MQCSIFCAVLRACAVARVPLACCGAMPSFPLGEFVPVSVSLYTIKGFASLSVSPLRSLALSCGQLCPLVASTMVVESYLQLGGIFHSTCSSGAEVFLISTPPLARGNGVPRVALFVFCGV